MTDIERLAQRVDTIERAVGDGTHEFPAIEEVSQLTDRIETIETRLDRLEEQTTELDGATQALRGYVGNIRSVNERVEQRADAAIAATDRLERELDRESNHASHELSTAPTTGPAGPNSTQRATDGKSTDGLGSFDKTELSEASAFDPALRDDRTDPDRTRETADHDPGVFERIRSLL